MIVAPDAARNRPRWAGCGTQKKQFALKLKYDIVSEQVFDERRDGLGYFEQQSSFNSLGSIVTLAEELRQRILEKVDYLEHADLPSTKDDYRRLHQQAVDYELQKNSAWLRRRYPHLRHYFAYGNEIDPVEVRPTLIEVRTQEHTDIFRIARLTWSLPFTRGYGRRLRFIIFDENNKKVIGILGMQSPPLDFAVRDRQFSYPPGRKVHYINQTLDIFTLGAVPPYNRLLGGKLVALAAASDEVRNAYALAYGGKKTQMIGGTIPNDLVALTTTSAFGRSSIYNRLRFGNQVIAQSIGYTVGYGSFHLMSIYPLICAYLEQEGIDYKGGFGAGPRVVWQNYTKVVTKLGIKKDILKHGIKREVFLFPLIRNLRNYMSGIDTQPDYYARPFRSLAEWWRDRWLLPRASRVDGWHTWDPNDLAAVLFRQLPEAPDADNLIQGDDSVYAN